MGECTEKEIGECVWLVCKKNWFSNRPGRQELESSDRKTIYMYI